MGKPGEGKFIEATPEAILRLIGPVLASPDSEHLMAAVPILKLLSSHIEPVIHHPELLEILMSAVKGVLMRAQTTIEGPAFKYLIRVVE